MATFLGKRRKIRCTFPSGNSATCVWCLAHDSACVSQQYQDDGSDHSRSPHMEERMLRVESMLERVLEKLETGVRHTQTTEPSEHATTTEDSTGIDVINTASISAPSSTSNVVSVFRNASFMLEIGGEGISPTDASALTPNASRALVPGTAVWPKLRRVSHMLLELTPPRAVVELIDNESSPWISQLLRPLPSLRQSIKFSLLRMLPIEPMSASHPTVIARALMVIVICLQQLPKSTDMNKYRLPSSRNDFMEHLTTTIISLVTSDDELIATSEGLECLLLMSIYFVNSGRPRRAWLNNRRALAVAQLMDLHKTSIQDAEQQGSIAGIWPHIVHHDHHLSEILGFPCGVVGSYEPFVLDDLTFMQQLSESQQDMLYQRQLDRIAAHLVERDQRSPALAVPLMVSIDSALSNLAKAMPYSWWHPFDRVSGSQADAMGMLYSRYNVQLWHHHLDMSNHLPFMLDVTDERRSEYSRIQCLRAARELIKVYIPLRTTFGMFSCCMTNFQAFTAAVAIIFNMFLQTSSAEFEVLSGQRAGDWALIAAIIDVLDAAIERFDDRVALQARDVLKLLQAIENDPRSLKGDRFHFTIPYFGVISIARKMPAGEPSDVTAMQTDGANGNHMTDPSAAVLSLDDSPSFMTTIDFMGSNTAVDVDELMKQWLVDEM
ncbi:hypothetical protein TGAM01_v206163 [Trichoderma gamsii]|uniref:Transcription factor domain-containing protein n=1 Tax=Trichoderma gamsii TaxID=398673 RepID=A0A2P4ZLB9_9HYPO|nr:hypothetical protein TGAM01_v206163 [Trichoderma gamsii]PON25082.1 hypothetical protein TGAM01_v206163 [Trichoderma gamsii]